MRIVFRLFGAAAAIASAAFLTSCGSVSRLTASSSNYHVVAHRPHDPSAVEVKLSLATENVYVMEGDRLLMAAKTNVGKPGAATPTGDFHITNKDKTRRRQSEPDAGYPMAYWNEFAPAYGFHEGFVWPVPHTHGCVRMHREAAARLFALTRIGTPVHIRQSLPEDAKFGSQVTPLDQSRDPDPPRSLLLSSSWFKDPPGPLLVD
ncbi:MAG: L,D-transpeptidase [Chthoniobacterales bacterium]